MAIHFVILLFMLLIVIGIIATGLFTDIPILIPLGFFFLMLSGLFVTISEGVIIDQRVSTIDAETLEYSYGLVLTLFSSFAWFINPMDKKSPFNY